MIVEKEARTCFVLMLRVEGIWCTKLIQDITKNDLKDVMYDTVQWMHRVFCADEMMQLIWEKKEQQSRRSEEKMSEKTQVKVVSIWQDSIERICNNIKSKWEVSIDDDKTNEENKFEMKRRWELNIIFEEVWRMRYDWRKQIIMRVETIFSMIQKHIM